MSSSTLHRSGITFATTDCGPLRGDLYLPDGEGPFPVVIGVPGGAWRISARSSWRDWGEHLAARGYAFFAVEYRTATYAKKAFPEAVCDLLAAIRYLRGNATDLSLASDRIGLFGASAGAHIAALAALSPDHPSFDGSRTLNDFGAVPSTVKTLIAAYGIYDLFRHWQDDLILNPAPDGNVVRNLLGTDPFDNQQLYFDASPIRHVTYAANKLTALVTWGTDDEFVQPSQSEAFVRVLQQARFNVRTFKAVGASHFWVGQPLNDPTAHSAIFAGRLVQFLSVFL